MDKKHREDIELLERILEQARADARTASMFVYRLSRSPGRNLGPKGRLSAHELSIMPYEKYLETPHWKELRRRVFEKYGYKCESCGSQDRVEVHHVTYERRGYELLEDLQPLCRDCHKKEHGIPVGAA